MGAIILLVIFLSWQLMLICLIYLLDKRMDRLEETQNRLTYKTNAFINSFINDSEEPKTRDKFVIGGR